jgi:predicted dehydrogenase
MTAITGVALVGAGYWGRRVARNLAAADGCELRMVCDPRADRARDVTEAFGGVAAGSLDEVLADDEVVAVVVATPASTHAQLVDEVLSASRHVLVEKPLAESVDVAARLATVADGRGLVLMCDQTYRFAPAVASIRDLLADPVFGPVVHVESSRTNLGHDQPDVDVFWDLAYHDVSILDAVLPEGLRGRVSVRATAGDVVGRGRAHRGELIVQVEAGPSAHIVVDWHSDTKLRAMRFSSATHAVTWDDGDAPAVHRDDEVVPVRGGEPLAAVVADFVDAIAERRAASCGPSQELRVLAVLAGATESAAHDGRAVVVDLARRDIAVVA